MHEITTILLQNIYTIITILNIFLAIIVIFMERRNIAETWAWLMVLLFLPVLGFILYLIFGQNMSRRKLYKLKEEEQSIVLNILGSQWDQFSQNQYPFCDPEAAAYQDMIMMNLSSGMALYTQDNSVDVFTDGKEKFEALFKTIEEARDHIHLMYYIFIDDDIGRRLRDALISKAKEGVEIRLLYDDVGSANLSNQFFRPFNEAGGKAAAFFPSKIPYLNIRVNYRNHRKLVIIDGQIGFLGGFNISNEYLGLDQRIGYWRDTHLRICGSAVLQLQAQFFLDWNLASSDPLQAAPRYFPMEQSTEAPIGQIGIQIVSSGPDNEREQIKDAYIKMIYKAKKCVWIQTPYFIPDESLLNALRLAALSGIDVRIMIPRVPDHKMVYWATYSYLGDLLPLGVRCFLYEKGFLHAKTIVVDGLATSVGTANFDIRSFKLNFETNAFLYNREIGTRMLQIYEKDIENCCELSLDEYEQRSRFQKAKESFTRLLSPIL
ncbi:cardiolipin synthase [Desulforamulus aeronauticus]|uniref:Cardiolipin synthase n=1 Tax=Desulforamulus aeronauticus DSM 10349 TaxID=1121421 RepID=A0A1M6NZ41_9FIRM|nr:cardiolipin synthase [Desulforamulus aeronauticus]SHK00910.1 cardiolipin synthase [Desulforamulus aeronauticus DSM 10349]